MGGGSYRLQPDSPAIDAGTSSGAPTVDMGGTARPLGAGHDMGCYETMPFYYVRTDGNNSNTGTGPGTSQAWATVKHALTQSLPPGSTVYVQAGTYTADIAPTVSGTSGSPIQLIADRTGSVSGWSAGEVTLAASSSVALLLNNDNYLHFKGFKINGQGIAVPGWVDSSVGIRFEQCEVTGGNSATDAFYATQNSTLTVENCLVHSSRHGFYINGGSGVVISNCTIVNHASTGVFSAGGTGTTTVTNSILANNVWGLLQSAGTITHSYNNLYNTANFSGTSQGTGEILTDPLFVGVGDYRLQPGSPAIDAGTSSGAPTVDMGGTARPAGAGHDLGCYEMPFYYVRTDGNNSNTGTGEGTSEAWATVEHALTQSLAPGSTVYVQAGTYTADIAPTVSGTSGSPIQLIADRTGSVSGWSAGEVTLAASSNIALLLNNDNYLHFKGFKINGQGFNLPCWVDSSVGSRFEQCEVTGGNSSTDAFYATQNSTLTVQNCLVHSSRNGFYINGGSGVVISNCTIVNHAITGVYSAGGAGTSTVTNCIFANNDHAGIQIIGGGTVNHTYNLLFNGTNFRGTSQGTGEILSDPLFTGANSYYLREDSPAIDAGTSLAGVVDVDKDGQARPLGGGWDLGCYEGSSLVGYWKLDETSGVTATDSSGYGHHGTLTGGASWSTGGSYNAVDFNGSSAYVALGNPAAMNFAGQITISAWVKARQHDNDSFIDILCHGEQSSPKRSTSLKISGGDKYQIGSYSPTEKAIQEVHAHDLNRWVHLVGVYDGTQWLLYRNGLLEATLTGPIGAVEVDNEDWAIGAEGTATRRFLDGEVREVRLYRRGLSPAEVAALYGVVGYWRLDETSGSVAVDASGAGNDASYAGSPTLGQTGAYPAETGSAIELNGSSQSVTAGAGLLDNRGAFTLAGWVRAENPSQQQALFGQPGVIELGINGSDELSLATAGGGTVSVANPLLEGKWQHVLATGDGTELKLFVNGELVAQGGSSTASYGSNAANFKIGAGSVGDYFAGALDEVVVLERTVQDEEAFDLYKDKRPLGIRILQWLEVR
jgi:hypothetical protein